MTEIGLVQEDGDFDAQNFEGGDEQQTQDQFQNLTKSGRINVLGQYNQQVHRQRTISFHQANQEASAGANTSQVELADINTNVPAPSGQNLPAAARQNLTAEQLARLEERRRREAEQGGSAQDSILEMQVQHTKSQAAQEICCAALILIIFASLMGANSEETELTKQQHPDQLLWMYINIGVMAATVLLTLWKMCCISQKTLNCSKCLDLLLLLVSLVIGIWGAVIMFSDQYNSHGTIGQNYVGKGEYRKIFEAMALLRFIGLLCFGCLFCMLCCILVPLVLSASAQRRREAMNQTAQNLRNVPIFGALANNLIDQKSRSFDESKDGQDATCTICYEDFKEDPNNPIAELNCSSKHIFHANCLKQWVSNGHNSCPLCKEEIVSQQ